MIRRPLRQDRFGRPVVAPVQRDAARTARASGSDSGSTASTLMASSVRPIWRRVSARADARPAVIRVGRDEPPEYPGVLVRLPDGVASQAPGKQLVEGHRGQPRQGLEVFVELASAQQYPVDEDQLPVAPARASGPASADCSARGRQADAVPSQLDLPGQQARPGGGWVIVRDLGQFGERLVGAAKPLAAWAFRRWSCGVRSRILSRAASACLYLPARRSASAACRICSGLAPVRVQAPHAPSR